MMTRALAALAAIAVMAGSASGPDELRRHEGSIVAGEELHRPLAGAWASAYTDDKAGAFGPCATRAPKIARSAADQSGVFAFHIDSRIIRYYAIYCAQGYQPRGEWNRNEPGRRVRPDPVRLWPVRATTAADVAPARRALGSVLDYAALTLREIGKRDPTAHRVAKEMARAEEIQVLELLAGRVVQQALAVPRPDRSSPEAVVEVLDNAASHVRYYWRVAPVPFADAVRALSPGEQAAVFWLRNRPRTVFGD